MKTLLIILSLGIFTVTAQATSELCESIEHAVSEGAFVSIYPNGEVIIEYSDERTEDSMNSENNEGDKVKVTVEDTRYILEYPPKSVLKSKFSNLVPLM